jgi:nucleoid-associated protein YgaU
VTLLAAPLTSGVAVAAQPGGSPPPATSAGPAAVLNLDRPLLPDLDRPFAPANAPVPAPPPASISAPATQPAAASLLTGTPHRETATSSTADNSYVVRPGDTLWGIAARHLGPRATDADIARDWPRWYAANRIAIGSNPALIHPGLVLHAPVD